MGPGLEPALRGPTWICPSGETHATLPPPAPTVFMSTCGTLSGMLPMRLSTVTRSSPSWTRHTSVLVPPMSQVMTPPKPAAFAAPTPAVTPPAGPESTVWTGVRRARASGMTPPLDAMM